MSVTIDRSFANSSISLTNVATTVYTFSVPANTLMPGMALRLWIGGVLINSSGANRTYTVTASLGGTTFIQDALIAVPTNAARRVWNFNMILKEQNATNSQVMWLTTDISAPLAAATGFAGDFGTVETVPPTTMSSAGGTIDMTAARTLLIQITSDAATAVQSYAYGWLLELI